MYVKHIVCKTYIINIHIKNSITHQTGLQANVIVKRELEMSFGNKKQDNVLVRIAFEASHLTIQ